jgi:hypothetical protein
MKINYIKGNLLEAPDFLIGHGCNAQGVMGSGVAKYVREKWPNAYEIYHNVCIEEPNNLGGRVIPVNVGNDKYVLNMITQNLYGTDSRKANYEYIYSAFESIKEEVKAEGSLAIPFIGCGLAGGSWHIIKAIIEKVFDDTDISINVYYVDDVEFKRIMES